MSWRDRAACRGEPPGVFFPSVSQASRGPDRDLFNETVEVAVSVCGRCSVRDDCLAYGVEGGHAGVWGGRYLGHRSAHGVESFLKIRDGRPETSTYGDGWAGGGRRGAA